MLPGEAPQDSPYSRLRVARIERVYFESTAESSTPSEQQRPLDTTMGRAYVKWLDAEGGRDLVQLAFPYFSNHGIVPDDPPAGSAQNVQMDAAGRGSDAQPAQVGLCYGDLSLPSRGDIVLIGFRSPVAAVIIGYLPNSYAQQTDPDEKPSFWGTMRRIQPGELTRQSKQQAEIYMDRAGAVQIVAKAQPVAGDEAVDGSATDAASDIDPAQVPEEELVRLIVGEAYDDETFAARMTSLSGKKVIFGAILQGGPYFMIFDSDANFELTANSVNLYQQSSDGSLSLISINAAGQISMWDRAGNQVILDADNSKIIISSENGDNVMLGSGKIQVATKAGNSVVVDDATNAVTVSAQSVSVNAGQVSLGASALNPLGLDPVVTLARLLLIFNTHTHVAGTGVPTVPMTPIPGLPTCPGSPTTVSA